ncbi:MAG: Hsp20/alpha crystallin family protein [Planctomycetes bacterium]|nr:Hsp20/alpha crystallin family protein [Planctomycetota bacterium]
MAAKDKGKSGAGFGLGLGGVFQDLGRLIEKMGELAGDEGEVRREGEFGGKSLKGVYGFSFRLGGQDRAPSVVPFGNLRRDAAGGPAVAEEREPLVDIFDEPDRVLVVAEMPGVTEDEIAVELAGDVLVLAASGKDRKYRKEVLLPGSFDGRQLSYSYANGILEVRLAKQGEDKEQSAGGGERR